MISKNRMRLISWIMLGIYICLLLTLTHMPTVPDVFKRQNDKTLHFMAYFVLSGLTFFALGHTLHKTRIYVPLMTLVSCVIFGALDEITQPPFGRTADILDWRMDAIATLAAVIIMTVIRWLGTKNLPRQSASS